MSEAFLSISDHGDALGRRAGEGRRRQPALRTARLQALGRPRVRRPRTLRARRHRIERLRSRIGAGAAALLQPRPRRRARPPPCERDRGHRGRQGLRQQREQVRLALPALRPRQRRTGRRVRRAERRRLLQAARSRPGKARLPARRRRQAGDRRDGGGRPVPAAADSRSSSSSASSARSCCSARSRSGSILAQVLLLLLLAFAPVALVAAAIPGRGHAFFKGWLEKLAGYLLRKAAYSLILAILLAVNGALASATAAARLADVLRPAGALLLGRLPPAQVARPRA